MQQGLPLTAGEEDDRYTRQDISAVRLHLHSELAAVLGADFESRYPADLLDSYCMATVKNDDPTGVMLGELITWFMAAYANKGSNPEALKALDYLGCLAGAPLPPPAANT